MEPDTIKEEATCQTKTPTNQKRMSKPKKRYTPPDQSTPKPPKGRSRKKTTREDQSPTIKKHQLFQHVIVIQLGYQSERGKKSDPYQNVGILIMVYLTIDGV